MAVHTGVYIDGLDDEELDERYVPELQIQSRTALAAKGIVVPGVFAVGADHHDEITVLLWNTTYKKIVIGRGDFIAKMVQVFTVRIRDIPEGVH